MDRQVDQLLIVSIAFAAFHRGTRTGLASATIVALSLGFETQHNPTWTISSEGVTHAALVLISLPLLFSAGSLRQKLLRSADERAELEHRHAHELDVALQRAKEAEESLARLNRDLETTVRHRTHEVQQAVEALIEAEEQLNEANEEARFLLKALDNHAGIVITNAELEIQYVNRQFVEITGFESEDVHGKTADAFYQFEDPERSFQALSAFVLSGQAFTRELPFMRKDGKAAWIELTIVPQLDAGGGLARTVAMFTDITKRKANEEQLREHERRFRSLSEAAFEGLMFHAEGIVLDANRVCARLFGFSGPDDMVGRQLLDVLPMTEDSKRNIKRQLSDKRDDMIEVQIIGPRGEVRTLETQGRPTTYQGQVARVVALRDITDRKEAEQELVRFSRAVWQSPASVVITDKTGAIQYVNPTFEEVTGYTLMEVFGQNPRILKSGQTEDVTYQEMWRLIASGNVWTGEICNRKKSGELYWEHASISGIQDESGEIVSYVAVKVDITAQRAAQAEIEESHLEIVKRLALATEFRDDDTGAHVQRIGYFAAALGEAYGLSAADCQTLTWASALHDIGKLAIPDAILLKPGKLTDEEYAVMKTHAILGAKMLEGGKGPILEMAQSIARTHHERWNGSGYPAGLSGEDIPLEGRIVAICDVFDALTSERPYKRAWTFGEAMAEIERCAGTHFDPHLAKLFVANGSKIQLILQMLASQVGQDDEGDLLAA